MTEKRRTVVLRWEYSCEYSPLWPVSRDLPSGSIDVADLGVDDGLRQDLATWNGRMEVAADPNDALSPEERTPEEWWGAARAEGFGLAARLQRRLGNDWTVWCGGEGGATGSASWVLRDAGLERVVEATTRQAEVAVTKGIAREVRAWAAMRVRVAVPGFDGPGTTAPAEHRARALELCGRLQAAVPLAHVAWLGGEAHPAPR